LIDSIRAWLSMRGFLLQRMLHILALIIAISTCPRAISAADYPNRAVHVIIPFSAGGAPDIVMRILAQALSDKWRQSVIVENRPGGNTVIGTMSVIRNPPDGYTLLFTADGTFILNPLLYASLPYTMRDLVPVTLVATTPHVLAVSKNVPAQDVRSFVALAKTKPRTLTFGSTGPGSIQRLAFEYFSQLAGIELVHVPYRGASETATALLAGEVDASINGAAVIFPYLSSGVRALAITTKRRSELAPDLPTVEEAGVSGYSSQGAFGLLVPAGVPQEIQDKIEADVAGIIERPKTVKLLEDRTFERAPIGPAEFRKLIAEETEKWRVVITEKGIKGD
jgi:tripartite-type tricarboxylate transporter receptor subunit TctC